MLDRNTCNHLTVCKQMSYNNLFIDKATNKLFTYVYIYIYVCVCVSVCVI